MSRRDDLRNAQATLYRAQQAPKVDQPRPEKICGLCAHYSEGAFSGHGAGTCGVLKMKSDITVSPPVYDTKSQDAYMTLNLRDAANCQHYRKMDFVDKDGTECSDPRYRRSMRQMQDL